MEVIAFALGLLCGMAVALIPRAEQKQPAATKHEDKPEDKSVELSIQKQYENLFAYDGTKQQADWSEHR